MRLRKLLLLTVLWLVSFYLLFTAALILANHTACLAVGCAP